MEVSEQVKKFQIVLDTLESKKDNFNNNEIDLKSYLPIIKKIFLEFETDVSKTVEKCLLFLENGLKHPNFSGFSKTIDIDQFSIYINSLGWKWNDIDSCFLKIKINNDIFLENNNSKKFQHVEIYKEFDYPFSIAFYDDSDNQIEIDYTFDYVIN